MKLNKGGVATLAVSFTMGGVAGAGDLYDISERTHAPIETMIAENTEAQQDMMIDDRILDAKIEAVEARTDSKFSQVMAELKIMGAGVATLGTKMAGLETKMGDVEKATGTMKWSIVATGLVIGGLIIALAAFGTQIMEYAVALFSAGSGAPNTGGT